MVPWIVAESPVSELPSNAVVPAANNLTSCVPNLPRVSLVVSSAEVLIAESSNTWKSPSAVVPVSVILLVLLTAAVK